MSERALAIDIVRGWGLEFDGTGDPKEFVGRIEDAAATYGIRLDHITSAMMFLLKGYALDWWHDNAIQMADWITFKRQLNLHFVRGRPAGQHPYKRLLPRNRENLRKPWDTSQQWGGGLTKRSNNKRLITSPEQVRTEQPQMKKPLLLTDCIRQQEDDSDLHPEESSEEDRGAPTTNPSEETAEIPQVIQEAARLKQAQTRRGQQVSFIRSFEGKAYRVKINRGGYLSISQLGPDLRHLSENQTNQPTMNAPQLLADGGFRQQDDVIIDSHAEKSCEDLPTDCTEHQEDNMELHPEGSSWEEDHDLTNPSEETAEIPQVIQEAARLKQAQTRRGQQVSFIRSFEGKAYRVKINRGGYLSISQLGPDLRHLSENQTNQPTMNAPQLLADGGSRQQDDVIDSHAEKSCEDLPTDCTEHQEDNMELHPEGLTWEEDHELTNSSEETAEIPQVIQEEARLKQAQTRRGQQACFKRSVEGKEYRVKINRGGYVSICQLKPDQQAPINGPQLPSETRDPEESCEEDRDLTNPSEETTEIPLVIQQEARWRQAQKRPGQEVFFEMNAEGKEYLVQISASGNINISHLKTEQVMDDDQTEQPPTTDGGSPEQEDIHVEESCEEDREVPLTYPSEEEATEIPLVIQEEAQWREAHKRPGEQMCYKNSFEGKEYRIRISRSGNINIVQLKPKQVMDNQTEQPPVNEAQIPLVIQQEVRWRQAHKRPGVQVCYKRSVEGKEYRIKISRAGIVNICQLTPDQQQLSDDQTEEPSVNEPQIPLVIQQEARLRQANSRPGQQVCYKRTVEGINYRVKINRGRYLTIDLMENNVWTTIWKNSPTVAPDTTERSFLRF